MAIVITNGALYIYLTEDGKHRKTDNISYALCFDDLSSAVTYMKKLQQKQRGIMCLIQKRERSYGADQKIR